MRQHIRVLTADFFSDPRHFQILSLGTLLTIVTLWSDFAAPVYVFALTALTALSFQFLLGLYFKVPQFDFRSPLITALSLTLLFKTNLIWLFPVAAFLAIASKFTVRVKGKHVFNPANFGIVMCLIVFSDYVWVSPGQWGSAVWTGFLLICLAVMVLSKARRGDIALFFLGSWAALLFGRALWLGDPFSIPLHNMQAGTLLIFAFFMISDPKTTPDHWFGRLIFAAVTALIAFTLQYGFQVREGLFYALFLTSMAGPVVDMFLKDQRYQWRNT